MDDGYLHNLKQSAQLRLGSFTLAAWALGGVLGMVILLQGNLLPAAIIMAIFLAIGLPIPNIGPVHQLVQREWEARAQWRADKGHMLVPSFMDEPDGKPSKIERVEVVYATVESRVEDKIVRQAFPILTDDDRDWVTVPIKLGGASQHYLRSDPDGRYLWDLDWFTEMADALGTTKEPKLSMAITRSHRPANMEPAFRHVHGRGADSVFSAQPGTLESQQADNIAERINMIDGGSAGNPTEMAFIRTPWPTRARVRTSLEDTESFKRSSLYRTVSAVIQAYNGTGVSASFLTPNEVQLAWDNFFRIADSDTVHMLEVRDKAIARLLQENGEQATPAESVPLDKGVSITSSKPGEPAWINYNGTFFIAGQVTKVQRPQAQSGFRGHIALSDDTYYAWTVYVDAKLRSVEQTKARERERAARMVAGERIWDKGLSNPHEGEGEALDRIVQRRAELQQTGNRTANYWKIVSIGAPSLEEATFRWEDMVMKMAKIYTITQFRHRQEIEDALLVQWGLRFK